MIVTLALTGMLALGLLIVLAFGLAALRFAAPDAVVTVLVIAGAVIVLGWWIGSVLVGVDDSLAPERFALLPVTARAMLPGLVVAGATTIGGIGTTIALLLMLLGWSVHPLSLILALAMLPVALATCVLGARVVTGLLAGWLARRSSRDLVVTLGVLLMASSGLLLNLGFGAVAASTRGTGVGPAGAVFADVVAWTPIGAAFGVPASVSQGDYVAAALRLAIAVATLVALWFAARGLLAARLVAPIQGSGGGRVRSVGLLDRMLPANAVGAIAVRTLRYSRRDPRHLINNVMLVIMPAIFGGAIVVNALQEESSWVGPVVTLFPAINALLTGTIMQMAMAYDNDAIAIHIHAGVSGAADRAGRLLGFGVILVPVTLSLCVAICLVVGRPDLLPGSLGASLGLTVVSAGAGAWVGSFLPGRAPAPEASPFGRGSSGGVQSLLAMLIMSPITLVLGGPALGFAIAGLWNPGLGWVSLGCCIVLGAAAVWGGAVLGGSILDRRWPEVLAEVSSES